ncbi:MAG: MCE family protein [Actinomycetota bacterium]|nr:MCE family protein [Actinomycetota bacterium]
MISFREMNPLKIGAASLAGIGLLLGLAFGLNKIPFVSHSYRLDAEFSDASGIAAGNEVRVAGVKIGTVEDVRLASDRVLVSMSIDNSAIIPRDATAEIGLSTILGTKFVGIDATGKGAPLEPGSTIRLEKTRVPFEVYDVSNNTVGLLSEIDAKQLNEGFRALANLANDPSRNLASALAGAGKVTSAIASQTDALSALATKGDDLLAALDSSAPQIQTLLSNANKLTQVLDRRRAIVQDLLRNTDLLTGSLSGLLKDRHPELDAVLKDLHTTLLIIDKDLGELEKAIALAGPTTQSFGRVFWTGRWANICIVSIDSVNGSITGSGAPPNDPVSCDSANAK